MDNIYKGCPPKMSDARFLTDYRTANTRNQYIKSINGLVRDDDYRLFLQQNTNQIMDNEWKFMKDANSCATSTCLHQCPTRVTNGSNYEELRTYDAVKSGKLKPTDKNYPTCKKFQDYRMTETSDAKYE